MIYSKMRLPVNMWAKSKKLRPAIRQFLNILFRNPEQKHYTAVSFWLILYAFFKRPVSPNGYFCWKAVQSNYETITAKTTQWWAFKRIHLVILLSILGCCSLWGLCHKVNIFLKVLKFETILFEWALMVFTIFRCKFLKKIQIEVSAWFFWNHLY
jgi:hypothetical protein